MATDKQKSVFALKVNNPALSYRKAMRAVGYSNDVSDDPGNNLIKTKGWQELINSYRDLLGSKGIDQDRIASKMNMLLDARDPKGNPVYDIQLKTANVLREDLGISKSKQEDNNSIQTQNNLIYYQMDEKTLNNKLDTLQAEIQELRK